MDEVLRTRLRSTFEEVPELYDRARPTYAPELFADLEALGSLKPGSQVLEMGCGTGKATVALAERGYEMTCVELGSRLAAMARRNLRRFPDVQVVVADFEQWTPRPDNVGFDACHPPRGAPHLIFHPRRRACLASAGGELASPGATSREVACDVS